MILRRAIMFVAASVVLIGCRTSSIVGDWHPDGREDQTMYFHEDGTFTFDSVWPHGQYGTGGPTVVPAGGVYSFGSSHHITIQTTTLGGGSLLYKYPPETYRYSLSADTLQLRSLGTNRVVMEYHRITDKE